MPGAEGRRAVSRRAAQSICGVRPGTASRKDTPAGIRPLRGQESAGTWRRETGDLQLSGLHAPVSVELKGLVLGAASNQSNEDAGEATGGERESPATHACSHSGTRSLARVGDPRAPALLWCSRKPAGARDLPPRHYALLVEDLAPSESDLSAQLGADESSRGPVASPRMPPPPVSAHAVCRLTRG